jgi:predicted ATPase/DNA-binding SARP family transcriptional activator
VAITEFRILGAIEAIRGGRPLPLGGAKQRATLALLLLSVNERVSADRLIEELWHDRAPRTAAKSLQMHVLRLRQALDDPHREQTGALLATLDGGYRLSVEPGALDRERFETAASEGRSLLTAGDPERAADRLRAALAEWRGTPFGDLSDEPFARLEVMRLHELRVTVVEDRVEADLAAGRHRELIGELETLIATEGFRERLWGQLMLALYRSGRQADALAAYRRVRAQLVEELGIEPGPELAQLHDAILAHDARIDIRPLVTQSTSPPSPSGSARPPGSQSPRRHNLPAVPTSFVGRATELSGIEAALQSSRVVTLTGIGGVGKTRLALEVAERTLPAWSGGVWLVELASVTEESAVAEAVAASLRLGGTGEHDLLDAIVDRLDERDLLLVLDNCEHVLDACARLAARVARGRSLSRLLATSRAPLAIAGERLVPIAPLPTPAATITGPDLAAVDAVRLFLERARQARPDFTAGPGDLEAVGELCRRLDGIPLAIELAASRVRAMRPGEIASRLGSRLALQGPERDREARHRNLQATIAWGHDLLGARPREVFRRLAVFPAPFSLPAAERVVGEPDVADAIVTLVDHSMLVFVGELAQTRYRMLDTVREFGLQRLADSGEAADTHAAYLDWAVDFVQEGMRHADGPQRTERLRDVEDEHRNLVGALATPGPVDRRLTLACGLAELLSAGTSLREIRRLLEDVLAAAGDADTAEVRRARLLLGRSLRKLGDLDGARTQLAATAHPAGAAGDRPLGAAVAAEQALVEIKARRQDDAQRFLDLSDRLGARRTRHVSSYRLLVEAQMRYELLGELTQARDLYETCIREVRLHGPTEDLILALAALAELAVELDDPDTVQTSAREVLAISDPVADAYSRAGAVLALGRAALRRGQAGEATAWLLQGARLDIERGSMEAPEMLESLAQAVAETGAADRSAVLLGAAAAARTRLGIGRLEREQIYVDAALAAIRGGLPEAEIQRRMAQGAALTEPDLLALVDDTPAVAVATEPVGEPDRIALD